MKTTAYAVLGLVMLCGSAMAQKATADEAAIKALEEKWDAANLKGDTAALGSVLANGFISTSAEGKVRSKDEMLAEMKSGDIKFEIAKIDDLKIYLYGDTGVVSGKWRGKFVLKGKPVDTTERFTDTYVRMNGKWQCVASHGSTIK